MNQWISFEYPGSCICLQHFRGGHGKVLLIVDWFWRFFCFSDDDNIISFENKILWKVCDSLGTFFVFVAQVEVDSIQIYKNVLCLSFSPQASHWWAWFFQLCASFFVKLGKGLADASSASLLTKVRGAMEGDESFFLLKFHCEYGIFFQCFEARTFQMFLLGSSFTLNLSKFLT